MKKSKSKNPLKLSKDTLKREDTMQLEKVAAEYQNAIDYINQLPYNMTYTYDQIKKRSKRSPYKI